MFGRRNAPQPPARQPSTDAPFLMAWRTPDGGMAVNIVPAGLGNAGTAGIILADLARHFARALKQSGASASEEQAASVMLELFHAEMDRPTDRGSGSLVN